MVFTKIARCELVNKLHKHPIDSRHMIFADVLTNFGVYCDTKLLGN